MIDEESPDIENTGEPCCEPDNVNRFDPEKHMVARLNAKESQTGFYAPTTAFSNGIVNLAIVPRPR